MGIVIILAGLGSITLSIVRFFGPDHVYYYWSFTFVSPLNGRLPAIGIIPLHLVETYEILLPWLVIGIVLTAIGVLLLIFPSNARRTGSSADPNL